MEHSKRRFRYYIRRSPARFLIIYILPALIVIALNAEYLPRYANLTFPSLDGYGHLAVGSYYLENIFPRTWGWVHTWSFGMPIPVFYPPLQLLGGSIIATVFRTTFDTGLISLVLLLTLALPGLGARVAWRSTNSLLWALVSGAIIAHIISADRLAYFGIPIAGTFEIGLFGHLIAFACALAWLPDYLDSHRSRASFVRSSLFGSLVILSSVHVIPVIIAVAAVDASAALFVIARTGRRAQWNEVLRRLSTLVVAILLSAFWWLPSVVMGTWNAGRALDVESVTHFLRTAGFFVGAGILAFAAGMYRAHRTLVILSGATLLLMASIIVGAERFAPSLPIHTYRYGVSSFILAVISFALAGHIVFQRARARVAAALTLLAASTLFLLPNFYSPLYTPLRNSTFVRDYRIMAQALRSEESPVLIEFDDHDKADSYAIGAELSRRGIPIAFTVLRESTPTATYTMALRNSLSRSHEYIGIFSTLVGDSNVHSEPIETRLQRAANFGIGTILARSHEIVNELRKSPSVSEIAMEGQWHLFRINRFQPAVEELTTMPVAVFSDINFKYRGDYDREYVRMSEEMLRRNLWNPLLVHPPDQNLDGTTPLNAFSAIVITKYRYRNLELARATIEAFAEAGGEVFLYRSDDPLFSALSQLVATNRARVVEERFVGPYRDLQREFGTLFDALPRIGTNTAKPVSQPTRKVSGNSVNISLATSESARPILIRSSYFPTWKAIGADGTYLAGPNFMLVFARDSFTLEFETPWFVQAGYIVSLVALIILVFAARHFRFEPLSQNKSF